jgi:alpha-L-fucosidase
MGPDARWIGNEAGVTRESEWSVIPVVGLDDLPDEKNPGGIAHLDAQAQDLGSMERIAAVAKQGGRLIWYPGQVDVSIRPGWFYHAVEDDKVKTLEHLLDIYYTSVGGNAQLLLNIPPDKRGRIPQNDVKRLKELGDRIRATFAVNFATGKNFVLKGTTTDDHAPGPGLTTDNDASAEFIEYDLGGPNTFNVARIRENIRYGQRVEAFALDAWDGTDWKEIVRGTTVGWMKLLRFPAVDARKVRLRILKVRGREFPFPVLLSGLLGNPFDSFGLYFDPGR